MASTGEVAAFGKDIQEAYWASLLSTTGFKKPRPNTGVLIGGDITKPEMKTIAQTLLSLGFKLYCSSPVVEEFLYPAMEDYQIDIMIGEGPAARSIKLDLPPFTLIGATTRAQV